MKVALIAVDDEERQKCRGTGEQSAQEVPHDVRNHPQPLLCVDAVEHLVRGHRLSEGHGSSKNLGQVGQVSHERRVCHAVGVTVSVKRHQAKGDPQCCKEEFHDCH